MARLNKEKPYLLRLFDIKKFPIDMARILIGPWILLAYRVKVVFPSKEAKKSLHYKHGVMVTSNHITLHDPFVVGSAFWRRRMFYLVGEFIMKLPVRGFLLKLAGCIKVDRHTADLEAMRNVSAHLAAGDLITVFAEGGITHNTDLGKYKDGAALMASYGNVPIIPVYFRKRKHWWNRYKVAVGELIYPKEILGTAEPSIPELKKVTDVVWQKTKDLEALV